MIRHVLVSFRTETGLYVQDPNTREEFFLPRETLDTDSAILQSAYDDLCNALNTGIFPVYTLDANRVSLVLPTPVSPGPQKSLGWQSRGVANWHTIKHALHARSLPFRQKTDDGWMYTQFPPEDWSFEPAYTRDYLESIDAATGCGVDGWGQSAAIGKEEDFPCYHCPTQRAARCMKVIAPAVFEYQQATDLALIEADPVDRTEAPDVLHRKDTQGTYVIARLELRGWRTLSTRKLLSRKAATTARRNNLLSHLLNTLRKL